MEGSKTYTVRSVGNTGQFVADNRQQRTVQMRRPVTVQHVVTAQTRPAPPRIVQPAATSSTATSAAATNLIHQQSLRRFVRSPPTNPTQLRYELDFADVRRCADKSKGLRHFSTKVCEKVKEKGRTNYNEVADELVTEYFDSQSTFQLNDEKHQYDMKNIRRRVYDALNVLLAMNIIQKNKKDIIWVGLPTSTAQEFKRLAEDKQKRQERIKEKMENLQELIIQLVAYKSLVEKNRERERQEGRPGDSSVLYLPYVIVNTEKRATVDCQVASDKSEFLFNFDQPFEIHDDVEVLKRLGLAHGLERGEVPADLSEKIKGCLPPALREYVDQIMQGNLMTVQRDQEKQVHYNIPTATAEIEVKPYLAAPRPAPSASVPAAGQRAPVVVAGAKYVGVKPSAMNGNGARTMTPPRRYAAPIRNNQIDTAAAGGAQRMYVQQPSAAAAVHHQQAHNYLRNASAQQQSRSVLPQYAYEQDELEDMYEEVYDDMAGEENIEYA